MTSSSSRSFRRRWRLRRSVVVRLICGEVSMHRGHSWSVVLLLGAALVLALPAGVIAREGSATEAPATPTSSGNRVDIGGRALFISCIGTGSPTVVLEAGSGNSADTWAGVQPEIARFTRVCSYDRAGLGQSDPAPAGVRTVQDSVDDLHALTRRGGYLRSDGPCRSFARRVDRAALCQPVPGRRGWAGARRWHAARPAGSRAGAVAGAGAERNLRHHARAPPSRTPSISTSSPAESG